MVVPPSYYEKIEKEIAELMEKQIRRPGMAFDDFVKDITGCFGQAKADEDALVKAGYEPENFLYNDALLQVLQSTRSGRILSIGKMEDVEKEIAKCIPREDWRKRILMTATRFVIKRIFDPAAREAARAMYRMVKTGTGDLDTFNDNHTLAGFLKEHEEIAAKIRPDGQIIDRAYLDEAESEAQRLIILKTEVMKAGGAESSLIDRQNRIITLCINARSEIKEYADAAFMATPEYYTKHYSSYKSIDDDNDIDEDDDDIDDALAADGGQTDSTEQPKE